MSPTLKRILLIALLFLAVIVIGFALFYFFNRTSNITSGPFGGSNTPGGTITLPTSGQRGNETETSTTGGPGTLPSSGAVTGVIPPGYYQPELVAKITSDTTLYPSLAQDGKFRYHNPSDGKFYHVTADGSIKPLSDQVFYNVSKVTWANGADKAVIEYPDDSKIVYDFTAKKQVTLPKHWQDFSFSPDAGQIAAKSIGISPDNRWLVTTNDDGTGTKLIETLGDNADKVMVSWSPSRQTVAFSNTGAAQGADRQEILLLGQNNENFRSLIVEGLDFESTWSPTGQKILYSVDSQRSGFKPELWVSNAYGDAIGTGRQSLQINTWAHKCTFGDDTTLYCAVPRDLPEGSGMSPVLAADSADDMFKIDLKTGLKTVIPLDKNYTVNTISYDKTHNKLFFTDTHATGAFSISL